VSSSTADLVPDPVLIPDPTPGLIPVPDPTRVLDPIPALTPVPIPDQGRTPVPAPGSSIIRPTNP
jgi:hypothetical protein